MGIWGVGAEKSNRTPSVADDRFLFSVSVFLSLSLSPSGTGWVIMAGETVTSR
jgi:hypothetical protein